MPDSMVKFTRWWYNALVRKHCYNIHFHGGALSLSSALKLGL